MRATSCDAFAHGFRVRLVADACRAKTQQMHWRHLQHIERYYATQVLTSYELGERVERPPLEVVNDTRLLYDVCTDTNVYQRLLNEVEWAQMKSRGSPVPRLVALQGELGPEGEEPIYRHPADRQPPMQPWSPTVERLLVFIRERLGFSPNHALIQHYRDTRDNISEHSDKTLDVEPGTPIVNS